MWTAFGISLAVFVAFVLYSNSLWKEGVCGNCQTEMKREAKEDDQVLLVCPNCGSWVLVQEMEEGDHQESEN